MVRGHTTPPVAAAFVHALDERENLTLRRADRQSWTRGRWPAVPAGAGRQRRACGEPGPWRRRSGSAAAARVETGLHSLSRVRCPERRPGRASWTRRQVQRQTSRQRAQRSRRHRSELQKRASRSLPGTNRRTGRRIHCRPCRRRATIQCGGVSLESPSAGCVQRCADAIE